MNTPHKHAELIKLWADGAVVEFKSNKDEWSPCLLGGPAWSKDSEYRVKPETEPDLVLYYCANVSSTQRLTTRRYKSDNLKLVFDGKTHRLKKRRGTVMLNTNTQRGKQKVAMKAKSTKNKPHQLDLFTDDVHETESEYFNQKLKQELKDMFPLSNQRSNSCNSCDYNDSYGYSND